METSENTDEELLLKQYKYLQQNKIYYLMVLTHTLLTIHRIPKW